MRYLTADDVLAINERLIGPHRVRDAGLVDAAVMRPQTTVGGLDAFTDIHAQAGALFHAITNHHAFLDGNKRTAVVAMVMFYKLNGWSVDAEQGEMYALALATAEGLLDVPDIAARLKLWASDVLSAADVELDVEVVEDDLEVDLREQDAERR